MNPDEIRRNIKNEYGDDIEFGGSREADGELRVTVKTGVREVTESMIEADYHSTHTEHDRKIVVVVDPETSEILREDDVR